MSLCKDIQSKSLFSTLKYFAYVLVGQKVMHRLNVIILVTNTHVTSGQLSLLFLWGR